jgi:hypothetical protein
MSGRSSAPEPWREHLLSLQEEFKQASRSQPPLFTAAVLGPPIAASSREEFVQKIQAPLQGGQSLVSFDSFGHSDTQSFQALLYAKRVGPPSEREKDASGHLEVLRDLAKTYLQELPDELLAKVLPSRNRQPSPDRAMPSRGTITDDWLEIVFHLAWQEQSSSPVLKASQEVVMRPIASEVGRITFPASATEHFEGRGFVKRFPHSLFSELGHDVWRSSEAAVGEILRLAVALCPPAKQEDTGTIAASSVPPLTETGAAVLALIKAQPTGSGITGREIVKVLSERGFPIQQSTLTKHVMPELKKWHGVKNRLGVGYYIELPRA